MDNYSLESWRKRFATAKKKVKGISIHKALASIDDHYDSVPGMQDYQNVTSGRAGLDKTVKAVMALEEFLKCKTTTKRHTKNLKI